MADPNPDPSVFPGINVLLKAIQSLYNRPRFRLRRQQHEVRGDRPLPLICLEHGGGTEHFLKALYGQLRKTDPPQVPHALVDVTTAEAKAWKRWNPDPNAAKKRETPIFPILDQLSDLLSKGIFGTGRLTGFDHYRLADWITGQRLEGQFEQFAGERIVQIMRTRTGADSGWEAAAHQQGNPANLAPNTAAKIALWLLYWIGRSIGLRWIKKRVPGLSGTTRWFMRQPFMRPRLSRKVTIQVPA